MSRLGILGGMFDPVHNGHINAARYAQSLLNLDKLKLVPCNLPNHRDPAFADSHHRLQMLNIAIAADENLEVDDCEIRRGGVSYAVDTLENLKTENPDKSLVFVLGVDAMNALPRWHRWERLFDLCHFLILFRDGAEIEEQTSNQIDFEKRVVANPQALFEAEAGSLFVDTSFEFDSSSTQVRDRLANSRNVTDLLSDDVLSYIQRHELYT